MLTNAQKITVYLEIHECKKWIKIYIDNKQVNSAVKMINRRLDLKRLLKEEITVTKFISTLTTTKAKEKYIKLLNYK